jgi:hypothetical protein
MKWDSKPVKVDNTVVCPDRNTESSPSVKLTDTVQRSTPFQEFLGDSKHPLAFSVYPFDVVLVPVRGQWVPFLVFSSIDHDLLTSLIQSLIEGAAL